MPATTPERFNTFRPQVFYYIDNAGIDADPRVQSFGDSPLPLLSIW
jgi:hypothetical protein